MKDRNSLLRMLPKLDILISAPAFSGLNTALLKTAARETLENIRQDILAGDGEVPEQSVLAEMIISAHDKLKRGSLYKVVNATGVPIHTNLGRSPIDAETLKEASELASGYCNLEYDIEKGKRGDRYHHAAEYLRLLTGAEDAIIVNNNASAVFLILNTFAKNKEVIVSRGELVEIGGSFRIPDVMTRSGAKLHEVGTTNKTHTSDYTDAVSAKTAMMMKVHKSNYEIIGFTKETSLDEIVQAAKDAGVLSYYDAGSGLFEQIIPQSVCEDITIPEITSKGFDLVSFSGDKMLGGCQAGIITGRAELIKKIKKNPLMRMLRVDKLTLAILQATFRRYIDGSYGDIPVNAALGADISALKERAEKLAAMLPCETKVIETSSTIGGGSCPMSQMSSYAVVIKTAKKPAAAEKLLRRAHVPVIARIHDEKLIMDVRTVSEDEFGYIKTAVEGIL